MKRSSSLVMYTVLILSAMSVSVRGLAYGSVASDVLAGYQQSGAQPPDPERARVMWTEKYPDDNGKNTRSCASCHTENLRAAGKHVRTNKAIEPLAPSINRERLTDANKIEKWFKRNCKWTFGRECSAQEKSDFLSYILTQ
ncbi:MAG: DUF1924 domain-containing protein [Gammaproteobacteria bacterium]|nr:DUF1924 domain-containing protein [Gammaproteobacteria bacterium]